MKVVKSFSYRGSAKLWSNRYHFSGGTPSSDANWETLFDAIVAAEKLALNGNTTITQCIAYLAGSDVPHHTKLYTTAGTLSGTGSVPAPGDCAAMVRYNTDAVSSKNHAIYLYNWYHGCRIDSSAGGDTLFSAQKTAFDTYGTAWITGFSDGVNTYHRAGPNGAVALGRTTSTVVRHRDFRN